MRKRESYSRINVEITLLITCFNQADSVTKLVEMCLNDLELDKFKVVVADDGSNEYELRRLQILCEERSIGLVTGSNVGTFQNIRRALLEVDTSHVSIVPGDDMIDASEFNKLSNLAILGNPNIAIAPRLIRISLDKEGKNSLQEVVYPKCTGLRLFDMIMLRNYNVASSGGMVFPTALLRQSLSKVPNGTFLLEDWINNASFLKAGGRILQTDLFPFLYLKKFGQPGITENKTELKKQVYLVREFVKKNIFNESLGALKDFFSHLIYKYVYIVAERSWLVRFHKLVLDFHNILSVCIYPRASS